MQRSKIALLPQEIRVELDDRIQSGGFANYRQITDWLEERCRKAGIDPEAVPSKTAVHQYGQELEDIYSDILLEAHRSRAFGAAIADQQNEYGLSLLRKNLYRCDQLIKKVYDAVQEGRITEEGIAKAVAPLLRVLSQMNDALLKIEKYVADVKARAETAAKEIDQQVRAAGAGDDVAKFIFNQVLGIAGGA